MELKKLFLKYHALKTYEYGNLFDLLLSSYKDKKGNLLEIGLGRGGAMRAYQEFFPHMNFFSIESKSLSISSDTMIS